MKILIIMDPGISVPPERYGGIERIVYLLANAYHLGGHEVTLLAGPGSYCDGSTTHFGSNTTYKSTLATCLDAAFIWQFLIQKQLLKRSMTYDLVHNFGRLIYLLPLIRHCSTKIMSYQRKITSKNIMLLNWLGSTNLKFTACSAHCISNSFPEQTGRYGMWHTIYNAVDFSSYRLQPEVDDAAPLIFLGRLETIKGAHTAIKLAKATGNKLWIAGNIPETGNARNYYKQVLLPEINGIDIIYLGALNDEQKNHYLGRSRALLFPIEWEEPFGIVMIEAMACGTPVIASARGAVPEVVTHGITGFVVKDDNEMCKAIGNLKSINRSACRRTAMAKFDIAKVAQQYLDLVKS